MGRLDRSVIPPLVAVLDCPDPALAADAATVLGLIGAKEATPFLTFPAASAQTPVAFRTAAQAAIARLTGHPFKSEPRTAAQQLTSTVWRYHRHQIDFPADPVVVWEWNNDRKAPVSREVPRSEAEAIIGLRLARQALQLDPNNRNAQVAQLSLALEKDVEKVGFTNYPAKDDPTVKAAIASGPSIMAEVLKIAIADGKTDLAAVATIALAQVTDRVRTVEYQPTSSTRRCTLCTGSPCPVCRSQGLGEPGSHSLLPRIKPGRADARSLRDQPAVTPGRGDRRQPQSRKPDRGLLDQPRI